MSQAAQPALELQNLCQRLGQIEIIRNLSLTAAQGERLGIIGPNGAGKSTLFDVISGRLAPSSGQVLLHGQPIQGKNPFEINRLGVSRSFQITQIFPQLSVLQNLRCAVLWRLGHRYAFWKFLDQLDDVNASVQVLLAQIKLEQKRDQPAANLSYAEQRALEVGITLAGGAQVLLLDEPTAGMSQAQARSFVQLIREVTVGKTLLIVEHDMGVVFDLADRIAVLVHGELLVCDSPAAVRANPQVRLAYLGPV